MMKKLLGLALILAALAVVTMGMVASKARCEYLAPISGSLIYFLYS